MPVTTEVTRLEENRVRLDVAVPEGEVQRRMERTLRQIAREIRVPGFRPGKAPSAVIMRRVGRETVVQEMLRDALGEWYAEALEQAEVEPIDDPDLDVPEAPDGGEFTFNATVQLRPQATLGPYKGLEVGKAEPEIPEGALEAELDRLRDQVARLETVDRPAESGDFLTIDFDGAVDGEKVPNATARDYLVELGGGRLVAGFDEPLVGAVAGETRTFPLTYADDDRRPDLAGTTVEYTVTVKRVQAKVLPELDDDFAAEASEFDTLDELRADIHHKLEHAQEHSIEDEFRQLAVDAAVAEADIDLPDELVHARAHEMWERTERVLRAQGVDPQSYLAAAGRTQEQMIQEATEDARRTLSRESVLEAVAEAEGIEVSDEELLEALGPTAEREGTKPDKLLARLKETGRDAPVRRELRLRHAVDAIAGSAQPIEPATAKAREALWTPEKQAKEEGSAQLWTPGAGEPPPKPR
jgi:trigger factor